MPGYFLNERHIKIATGEVHRQLCFISLVMKSSFKSGKVFPQVELAIVGTESALYPGNRNEPITFSPLVNAKVPPVMQTLRDPAKEIERRSHKRHQPPCTQFRGSSPPRWTAR